VKHTWTLPLHGCRKKPFLLESLKFWHSLYICTYLCNSSSIDLTLTFNPLHTYLPILILTSTNTIVICYISIRHHVNISCGGEDYWSTTPTLGKQCGLMYKIYVFAITIKVIVVNQVEMLTRWNFFTSIC
jgi:hypothetical protein